MVCRRFGAALPPPPGPPPQKGLGGHHVKERWWFRRSHRHLTTQDLEGALNRLTAPHVNTPPRSMVGSSAGAYQNPIHPSIMSARRKRDCANRPSAGIDRISPGLEDRGLCFWKGAKCRCTNGPDTPVESGITASRCIQATLCIANPPSTPLLNSHSGPCLPPADE